MSIPFDRFIFFIQAAPIPIIGIENGFIKSVNSQAEELLGWQKQDVIGQNFLKVITTLVHYELLKNKIEQTLEQSTKKGFFYTSVDVPLSKKSDLPFDATITFIGLSFNNTSFLYAFIQKKDFSRFQARQSYITQNDDRYHQLVESIQDYAIFMLDTSGIIISWNKGAQKIKGYTSEEIVGRHFSVFYLKKDIDAGKPLYALKTAAKDGKFEEENWRMRKDGTLFWASILITPLIDSEGKLQGFVKITRDLTTKKQSEEALKQVQEYYRLLLESFDKYAYFILDEKNRIESWNEESKGLFGYGKEEIISTPFRALLDDIEKDLENENFRPFEENIPFRKNCWFKRKNGSRFYGRLTIHEIKNSFESPQTLLVVIHEEKSP